MSRNYTSDTRKALADLHAISDFPNGRGRLIVWHGPPGTGKTTAIRSLVRSWLPWCEVQCITDPEVFFDDPSYIMEVIEPQGGSRDDHARLAFAEDCDDYLHADAKQRAGSGLGKLLNLTDGLLGYSHRTIVLITTNEPLRRLHPALARPGRALSEVGFTPFSAEAAAEWGVESPKGAMTLAEMYAATDQSVAPVAGTTSKRTVGFEVPIRG